MKRSILLGVTIIAASGYLAANAMAPSNRTGVPTVKVAAAETKGAPTAPPPYSMPKADAKLAPAGTYAIDKGHTSVTGQIRREGLSNYTFRFDKLDAKFTYDPAKPEATQVDVVLDPKSVDANNATWTEHLQANDLLNTASFTDIKFTSNSFKQTGPTTGQISGNVTFLGVTKPMTIDVTLNGVAAGNRTVIGFSGKSTVKIVDFPMPGFAALHLGNDVVFDIEAEFVKS